MLTPPQIEKFVPQLLRQLQQRGPHTQRGRGRYFPEFELVRLVSQITDTGAPDPDRYRQYRIWLRDYYQPLVSRAMLLLGYSRYAQSLDQNVMGHVEDLRQQPTQGIRWAKGFTCHTTHFAFDYDHRPIFLRLIGPQWSVEANWSALVNGRTQQFFAGREILYEGGQYTHKKKVLPCGWLEYITWHRDADVRTAENGAESVYVLNDRPLEGTPPVAFGDLLQTTLGVPTKQEWMSHLWCEAQLRDKPLIYPMEKSINLHGWSIRLDAPAWASLIEQSLKQSLITI